MDCSEEPAQISPDVPVVLLQNTVDRTLTMPDELVSPGQKITLRKLDGNSSIIITSRNLMYDKSTNQGSREFMFGRGIYSATFFFYAGSWYEI